MRFGFALRSMGAAANAEVLREATQRAEEAGLDTVWVQDHIAIPPDDTEGSDGRYLDPLTTLAWLAATTPRIHVGTAVLVVPYRPTLPTAKAIATVQELSGGRLELGAGVGWMDPEFRALGVDRHARGRLTDATLAFLRSAFEAELAVLNGYTTHQILWDIEKFFDSTVSANLHRSEFCGVTLARTKHRTPLYVTPHGDAVRGSVYSFPGTAVACER